MLFREAAPGSEPDRRNLLAGHPDLAEDLATFLAAEDCVKRRIGPLLQPRSAPRFAALPAETQVGDYELLEVIGTGCAGVVYKARQRSLNRLVALKMVRDGALASPEAVRRFRAEAEKAAALDHPNIVPVYQVGEHAGQLFLAMKLLTGGDLARRLTSEREQSDSGAPNALRQPRHG